METLQKIVSTNVWRAGSVYRMNDTDELAVGARRLREAARVMKISPAHLAQDFASLVDEVASNIFVRAGYMISFSMADDDNSQWERYAGVDGVAIGWARGSAPLIYDREGQYESLYDPWRSVSEYEQALDLTQYPLWWADAVYSEGDQRKAIRSAVREALGFLRLATTPEIDWDSGAAWWTHAGEVLTDSLVAIKNNGFSSEKEVRYVVRDPSFNMGDLPPIARDYLEITGGKEISYPDVQQNQLFKRFSLNRPRALPIVVVRIGPGAPASQLFEVRALLERDYPRAAVIRSTSTLRIP
jgi:hypothetical protein